METFVQCSLDEFGKPRYRDGEIERCVANQVSIKSADKKAPASTPSYPPGTLYVTTHRIFWVSSNGDRGHCNELRSLREATDASRFGAVRILLPYGRGSGVRAEFHSQKFGKPAKDRTLTAISDSLHRAAWNKISPATKPAVAQWVPGGPSTQGASEQSRAPVGTIENKVRKKKLAAEERGGVISSGFQSLDALEARAEQLVLIASQFRILKVNPDSNEQSELLNMMADMCIDSPVTREVTGNDIKLYRKQLATQLATYLPNAVVAVGGIMTVADSYCLINRVRATNEYVSPSDFTAALALFQDVVPSRVSVFRLESGVMALKIDMTKEPGAIEKIAAMAEEDGRTSISALEVMRKRNIPVQTALELLESAEQAELLVRDETTSGVRFFKNSFPAFLRTSALGAAVPLKGAVR